ncbi:sugar phosphate isomerase/epimerase [bacterium]|nr:sugar phosphate isomerase/epimerase [bacterium]
MKHGICNEIFKGWELKKVFSFIKNLGYEGLEIAPFTFDDSVENISLDKRKEVKDLSEEYGVSIIGSHWLLAKPDGLSMSSSDSSIRKRTTEYLCSLAEFTSDIGGELMVLGSPKQRNIGEGQTREEVKGHVKEGLVEALKVCESRNIDICLEPLTKNETNFINTASEAIELIEEISHPNLKLHLDVKAMSAESLSIPEIISNSKKYLRHFHVNDVNRMYPGSGEIDYAPILKALKEIDYQGWISLEVFDFSHGAETIALESIKYLKRFI